MFDSYLSGVFALSLYIITRLASRSAPEFSSVMTCTCTRIQRQMHVTYIYKDTSIEKKEEEKVDFINGTNKYGQKLKYIIINHNRDDS